MALVPIIQPAAIKLVTTKKERQIRMPYNPQSVSRKTRILFPIIVTIIAGLVAPKSVSLVGMLMFGNLLRECLKLESLSQTAQTTLANLITIVLGLTIASSMKAYKFVDPATLLIMALGLVAFVFDTIGGVLFAKLMNLVPAPGQEDQPHGGRRGYFSLSHVRAGYPENGPQGGQSEPSADARGGRQRGRSNRLGGGRRHHSDRGAPLDRRVRRRRRLCLNSSPIWPTPCC